MVAIEQASIAKKCGIYSGVTAARHIMDRRRLVELGTKGEKMNVDGLRELDQMAAKLEATVRKLPRVKCDELLQDVERIRAQLSALLSTASKAEEQPVPLRDLELKAKAK